MARMRRNLGCLGFLGLLGLLAIPLDIPGLFGLLVPTTTVDNFTVRDNE
jgi:hypothetical protein